jgi:hypothetical protein
MKRHVSVSKMPIYSCLYHQRKGLQSQNNLRENNVTIFLSDIKQAWCGVMALSPTQLSIATGRKPWQIASTTLARSRWYNLRSAKFRLPGT